MRLRSAVTVMLAPSILWGCCTRCPRPCGRDWTAAPGPNVTAILGADLHGDEVFIDMHCVRIPESRIASALAAFAPEPGSCSRVVARAAAKDLLASWQADRSIELVAMPSILTLAGQESSISIGETEKGSPAPSSREDLSFRAEDPSDEDGWRGIAFRMSAGVRTDKKTLDLDIQGLTRESPIGAGAGSEHAMAQVARVAARATLQSGDSVLLVSPDAIERGGVRHRIAALLSARVLDGSSPAKP